MVKGERWSCLAPKLQFDSLLKLILPFGWKIADIFFRFSLVTWMYIHLKLLIDSWELPPLMLALPDWLEGRASFQNIKKGISLYCYSMYKAVRLDWSIWQHIFTKSRFLQKSIKTYVL